MRNVIADSNYKYRTCRPVRVCWDGELQTPQAAWARKSAPRTLRARILFRSNPIRLTCTSLRLVISLSLVMLPLNASAQNEPATKPAAAKQELDTLVFANGEQLTGTLEKANAKGITFKSPMAGELTVKWANVKELRTAQSFAVLTPGQGVTRADAHAVVPEGPIAVTSDLITVATSRGPVTIPVARADQVIDGAGFDKALTHHQSLLQGWGGTATAGASLVRATDHSTTFNGALSLMRSAPAVDWLPARSRTTLDYEQSYGQETDPDTPTVKTNIFHADAERDEYFRPRTFAFASATFDHNFSQALDLEQAYGGGLGITLVKNAVRTLDLKGDAHFERESFVVPAQNVSIFGSTFSEKFLDDLPKGLVLNEFGSVSPAWTQTFTVTPLGDVPERRAYSAHVNASVTFPVYKGFGFNVGGVEDYLNNAPVGSKRNSVQFTTGLSYTIKPRE
jgi:hypothetical protein